MKHDAIPKKKTEPKPEAKQREEHWSEEQRLPPGKRVRYPSDDRYSLEQQNLVDDTRIARGCGAKPITPDLWYKFEYRLPPSEEILTWWTRSTRWRTVTEGFKQLIRGEVIRVTRVPYDCRVTRRISPVKTDKRFREQKFVSNDRFNSRYASLRDFIRAQAKLLAHGRPELEDKLAQRGLIRLGAARSDDPKILEREILKAMETFLRTRRQRNLKKKSR